MPGGWVQSLVTSRLSRGNDRRDAGCWPASSRGGEDYRPRAAGRFLAAGFPCHQGRDPAGIAIQANLPWPERLEAAHLRAVFAREGPVQRQLGLVGPAAIAAVPASKTRASQRTGSAGERLQSRRHQVALPAIGQSPVTGAGGCRRRLPHGLEVVGRPVAKGSAVPDGRPSASRVHRPAGRFRIPLSVFDFHERYPLSAETGGGHSIVVGSRSVRGSRKSSLHPPLVRVLGARRRARGAGRRNLDRTTPGSRSAHSIVGRGQLQRKQRLDAVGRR